MADETPINDRADAVGLFDLKLEELHPGDPGELSGVVVSMLEDAGEYAFLGVYINDHHCLGYLCDRPLRGFLRAAVSRVRGRDEDEGECERVTRVGELYPQIQPWHPSGAELRCSGVGEHAELAVYFGTHCFGVARGPALREFLVRAWDHATESMDESGYRIVEIGPRAA